jgi:hypothetical protein
LLPSTTREYFAFFDRAAASGKALEVANRSLAATPLVEAIVARQPLVVSGAHANRRPIVRAILLNVAFWASQPPARSSMLSATLPNVKRRGTTKQTDGQSVHPGAGSITSLLGTARPAKKARAVATSISFQRDVSSTLHGPRAEHNERWLFVQLPSPKVRLSGGIVDSWSYLRQPRVRAAPQPLRPGPRYFHA